MARSLTKRQKEIVNFIKEYRRKNGISPAQAEIARRFSITNAAVHSHLKRIEKKGVLTFKAFKHHSIQLQQSESRYELVRNDRHLLVFKIGDLEIPVSEFEGFFFQILE